jgi:hypothetical protein
MENKRVFNAPEGHTRLTINLPTELHEKIKTQAVFAKTTVGEMVSEFIKKLTLTTK